MKLVCGAMTRKGTPCQWDLGKCIHHGPEGPIARSTHPIRTVQSASAPLPRSLEVIRPTLREAEPTPPTLSEPPPLALAERDIRALAWWLFEQVSPPGTMETDRGRVLIAVLRLLESLGPGGMEQDERLREVVHVARLSLGIQPADDAEWDWVLARYEQDAIDEFHRWPSLTGKSNIDEQDG